MEQNTNAQGAQFRPVKSNYGAILQNHAKYMRKYKDDEEAKAYQKKANEREFQRKLANDREKLLPEIPVGEAQGFYRDQRIQLYQNEQKELSKLKQDFVNTGNIDSKLKYERRREFYSNANETTKAFTAYAKYIADNKEKDYNPVLDKEKLDLWENLANGRYELTKAGFKIPDNFNDDNDFIVLTPQQLNAQLLNHSRFSGKPNFETTGNEIADSISVDSVDGTIAVTSQNENESVRQWKSRLIDNPVQLNTIAKLNNLDTSKEIGEIDLNILARKLHEQYTLPKWKQVDNSAEIARKNEDQFLKREREKRAKKTSEINNTTISLSTDEQANALKIKSFNGTPKLDSDGNIENIENSIVFNLNGNPLDFGAKGIYTDLIKTDQGKVYALGQRMVEKEVEYKDQNGTPKTKFAKEAEYFIEYDLKVINNIARKIKNDEGDKLENATELSSFLETKKKQVTESKNKTETPQERIDRLKREAGLK